MVALNERNAYSKTKKLIIRSTLLLIVSQLRTIMHGNFVSTISQTSQEIEIKKPLNFR
jgi:hypothetical protein